MKKLINIINEQIKNKWPNTLKDSHEIANHISSHSSQDVDHELIRDYYKGAKGVLKKFHVNDLHEGDKDHNIRNTSKEKKFKKMPFESMPPIVVENNTIADGNHRFRVAKSLGKSHILGYDIVDSNDRN